MSPASGGWIPAIVLSSVLLPAPLSPDEGDDLAAIDVELDVGQRTHAAEALGEAAQLEQVRGPF